MTGRGRAAAVVLEDRRWSPGSLDAGISET
jgi:hypothetical protein